MVRAYHQKRENLEINANVMIAEPPFAIPADSFSSSVHFTYKGLSYSHVLRIVAWAKDGHGVPDAYCLPVHEDKDQVLFGAPKTFKTGEMDHLWDVKNFKDKSSRLEHQEKAVKTQVLTYLKESRFVSFVSLPVDVAKGDRAVLNIQSNEPKVFGLDAAESVEMHKYVLPFCDVLGFMVLELQARPTRHSSGTIKAD